MPIQIDLRNYVKQFVDLGSESYEKKKMRIVFQVAAVALFVLVAWKLLYRRK